MQTYTDCVCMHKQIHNVYDCIHALNDITKRSSVALNRDMNIALKRVTYKDSCVFFGKGMYARTTQTVPLFLGVLSDRSAFSFGFGKKKKPMLHHCQLAKLETPKIPRIGCHLCGSKFLPNVVDRSSRLSGLGKTSDTSWRFWKISVINHKTSIVIVCNG